MNTTRDDPREIEDLLPWYAAGTLSPAETRRVEDALARDPELAGHYALVREELAGTIHLNETLGAPSSQAMERLFARIDAEPASHHAISFSFAARAAAFLAGLSPRTLTWSASAAVLAIVLQSGLLAGIALKDRAGGPYRTASASNSAAVEGAYALIRFAPQASATEITALLERDKISIAGGPFPGGLYRIRVAGAGTPKPEFDALINRLREDKAVNFVAATQ